MSSGPNLDDSAVKLQPLSSSKLYDDENTAHAIQSGKRRRSRSSLISGKESVAEGEVITPRRSARLSSGAVSPLPLRMPETETKMDTGSEAGGSDESRPATPGPLEDDIEEPSSALATKILRAWDNPSPPPSPPPETNPEDEQLPTIDTGPSISGDESTPLSEQESDRDFSLRPVISNEHLLQESTPTEADLIESDASSGSSSTAPPMKLMQAIPPQQGHITTTDDLLALSSVHPVPSASLASSAVASEAIPKLITSIRNSTESKKEQVSHVLASGTSEAPSSSLDIPPILYPVLHEASQVQATEAPEPTAVTPVRRSSRARRIMSNNLGPAVSVSPSPAKLIGSPSSTFNRRKSSRGKVKELSTAPLSTPKPLSEEPGTSNDTQPLDEGSTQSGVTQSARSKGKSRQAFPPHESSNTLSPNSTKVPTELMPVTLGLDATVDVSGLASLSTPIKQSGLTSTLLKPTEDTPCPDGGGTPLAQPSTPPAVPVVLGVGRTPARRVPIEQAIAQGSVSPLKALDLGFRPAGAGTSLAPFAKPVFKPRALDDPLRSPAKRVPINAAHTALSSPQKGNIPMQPLLPSKNIGARSRSEEPLLLPKPKLWRGGSAEPSGQPLAKPGSRSKFGSSDVVGSTVARLTTPLPFPLVPSGSRLPPMIPEVDEGEIQKPQPTTSPAKSSPVKPTSSLRQPTVKPSSRIPRVGAKPYARPRNGDAAAKITKLSAPLTTQPASQLNPSSSSVVPRPRPLRIVGKAPPKVATTSGNSSDGASSDVPVPVSRSAVTRVAKTGSPAASTLKRKRDNEGSSGSPQVVPSVMIMRKVVTPKNAEPPTAGSTTSPNRTSPRRAKSAVVSEVGSDGQGRIKMRKVVGARKAKVPSSPAVTIETQDVNSSQDAAQVADVTTVSNPGLKKAIDKSASSRELTQVEAKELPVVSPESTPIVSFHQEPRHPTPPPIATLPDFIPLAELKPEIALEPETTTNHRRVTRSRRSAPPETDVFGVVTAAKPVQVRRKPILPPIRPPENSAFFGMSAVALKTLTNNNTTKNQKQVADLETEVVIKEGNRPDSPTTKVKTSLEKQREERDQQKQDRTQRRRRRLAEKGEDVSDLEGVGDLSMTDVDVGVESDFIKHHRGPGDEEDYVTPPRLKRDRSGGSGPGEKRVKWNRGLATVVYLDDISPKPRKPQEDSVMRGCLASSAKALQLDSLGNVPQAELPVPDIVVEHIVVKKFVYEDDIPPPKPESEPEPVPELKTRSRSKKAKS